MKNVIAAAALSLVLSDFTYAHEQRDEAMMKITPSTLADADIQAVSPALARFGREAISNDLWQRDALSARDRSIVTVAMLIARNQSSDWQQYNIKQNGDDFVLTPKSGSGNLKQFTINVGRDGTIHQFSAVEQDDQRSSYQLKSQQNGAVDASKFTFTPPKGVTVDDQRNK